METGNETIYETFRHKLTDTYDIVRIDDLGRQTVVDGGKEPRFRSTLFKPVRVRRTNLTIFKYYIGLIRAQFYSGNVNIYV